MEVHYTIRQLQYFLAVARTGSLSAAAARCHVSQPALSLAVSQLERGLGMRLLIRHRAKGTHLTEAGQRVLQMAEEILTKAEQLQTSAELDVGAELTGTLSVGCYPTLAPTYIPPLLAGFRSECPAVGLEFVELAQPELQRTLRDGVTELALLYEFQLDADLEYVRIDSLRPYVLLPADHRFATEERVSIAALTAEPMVLFDVPPSRANWERTAEAVGIEPMVGHRTTNFELARCLVGRGLGYTLLYQQPTLDLTYEGREVVAKPIEEDVPELGIVLGYLRGTVLSARGRRFADFAIAEVRAATRPSTTVPDPSAGFEFWSSEAGTLPCPVEENPRHDDPRSQPTSV